MIHQANDCIHINLLRPASTPDKAERILDEPFNPTWSYPIVGDEQLIVGYKNPKINLDFRANDLRPSLAVKYDQKTDLSSLLGEQKQVDIDTVFQDFMPQGRFATGSTKDTKHIIDERQLHLILPHFPQTRLRARGSRRANSYKASGSMESSTRSGAQAWLIQPG